jgi:hypothetical protein
MEMAGNAKYLQRQRSITDPDVGGVVFLSLDEEIWSDRSVRTSWSVDYAHLLVVQFRTLEYGPGSQGIDDDK